MSDGPASPSSASRASHNRFDATRQEYADYLPLAQRLQAALRDDAQELRAQEGWGGEVWAGVEEWIDDLDSVFRALRRNRYDEERTLQFLLAALNQRIELSLHMPIPSLPPYTDSPLFHILPLPDHTDRLGRPVAVLTVKEVVRDEDGGLDDLKEWSWWALEMVRRTLRDYWRDGVWDRDAKGRGGEGLVLVVDAAGASYRNMEVELLPTLLSVGHNNFPGMIEAVYVVKAGWTHRSMWGIIKRVLPRSALEKVAFLDSAQAVGEVFELAKLPNAYGGTHPYLFSPSHNPIFTYYSHRASYDPLNQVQRDHCSSRYTSTTSIADIYYSAPNTPMTAYTGRSRRNSSAAANNPLPNGSDSGGWRYGSALRMTKSREMSCKHLPISQTDSQSVIEPPAFDVQSPTPLEDRSDSETPTIPQSSSKPSRRSTSAYSPTPVEPAAASRSVSSSALQRIKSLSDFHLYLSPSRLANIDLLSDSDSDPDEEPHPRASAAAVSPPRRVLKPALLELENEKNQGLAERRLRPPLRLLGVAGRDHEEAGVRTYSGRLQAHHAKVLQQYTGSGSNGGAGLPSKLRLASPAHPDLNGGHGQSVDPGAPNDPRTISVETTRTSGDTIPSPSTPCALEPPSLGSHYTYSSSGSSPPVDERSSDSQRHHESIPVQAYDTSNPWFGYPAIRVPDATGRGGSSLRPRYYRNRKRDLIKTLLFLFMLRLQSLRDSIERLIKLGLAQIPFLGLSGFSSSNSNTRSSNGEFTRRGTGSIGPSEGLIQSAQAQAQARSSTYGYSADGRVGQRFDKDWWWMIIGFLLLRGTWSRIVLEPLEALGLGWGKEVMGW
ncbi:hypothetical protein IAU59_001045 [Kwoniella sp. CBS 9459]